MNTIAISVIIPVYNVELYLSRCLDSILANTFVNYEIILVDDGSTDNSSAIALGYLKKDKRVRLYRQKNKGLQGARATGISKAKGSYIVFIDSDDYITHDYLEKLYLAITSNEADIAICGFRRIDEVSKKCYSEEMANPRDAIFLPNDIGRLLEINTAVWNKIYRASIIKKAPVINSSPKVMEDIISSNLVYYSAKKIVFVPDCLYMYMVRKESLINNIELEEIKNTRSALKEVRKIYERRGDAYLDYIDSEAFLHLGVSLMYRVYTSNAPNFSQILKDNTKYLDDNFPRWRKNPYISLKYLVKNKGTNGKLWIVRQFYKVPGGFRFFLFCYKMMIDKLKVDVKW